MAAAKHLNGCAFVGVLASHQQIISSFLLRDDLKGGIFLSFSVCLQGAESKRLSVWLEHVYPTN